MRLMRTLVAAALVIGPIVATEDPASAAPAWSITPSPSPLGPVTGAARGVSCPTTTTCFAVGEYTSMTLTKSLVERWNGVGWTIVPSPNPAGAIFTTLTDVSCDSATSCFAVGFTYGSQTNGTYTQRWNGTAWSIVPSPTPAGAGSRAYLDGVSCASATSCFAVGHYELNSSSKALVERWNGTSWVIVASPNPAGATDTFLEDVSCLTASNCFAVGGYLHGSPAVLIERWNGTSWSLSSAPTPAGPNNVALAGVSCASATDCFAVGASSSSGTDPKTLIERWNGTSWSILPSPVPPGSQPAQLADISCPSATSCVAVGLRLIDPQNTSRWATLTEAWNGTSWSIVTSPNPANALRTNLGSVACASTTSCVAVGSYQPLAFSDSTTATLAARWNGTGWAITAPPTGASRSELLAVTCTSTTNCFAVGDSFGGAVTRPLSERWNGSAWSVTPGPAIDPSSIVATLNGVDCVSATSCFAVGSHSTSTTTKTLIERWNGTSWSVVPSPNPTGATSTILNGVSCASATNCMAVGTFLGAQDWRTFAQRWNGTSWSILPIPNPGHYNRNILYGVSCVSASACVAVGRIESFGGKPLTAHWDGTTWSIPTTPVPDGAYTAGFLGVSCVTATACTAVGSASGPEGPTKTLAENWNGTRWKIVGSANRTPEINVLNGVSCSSTTSCYAVGYSANDMITPTWTLAESWNGTGFGIVASPNPPGSTKNFFAGVSCANATNCQAVGGSEARGSRNTLIERYA